MRRLLFLRKEICTPKLNSKVYLNYYRDQRKILQEIIFQFIMLFNIIFLSFMYNEHDINIFLLDAEMPITF